MSKIKIALLLCTYQGERFLEKQLHSFSQQTETDWTLYVSDDGSTDQTLTLLHHYASTLPKNKVIILHGPRQGFAANFLSLVRHAEINADLYAFADQDDIWEKNKLARAAHLLPAHVPGLYCSRTRLIDEQDKPLGFTTLYTKLPCFKNALVQNIAGGNTMVINQSARELLLKTPAATPIALHDWWTYLLIAGCGGQVIYDAYPSVRYRQHAHNQIGANQSLFSTLFRINLLLKGQFARWNDMNVQALSRVQSLLTPENQSILRQYSETRHQSFLPRLWGLAKSGVFRQTLAGNVKLWGAAVLGKM